MTEQQCAVVGIGPGLGSAIARRFAQGGYQIIGVARDPVRVVGADSGFVLRAVDAADCAGLAAALRSDGGTPEVLIYNAYRATMAEAGPSSLDPTALVEDFRVNVAGALAAVQAVLPDMLRHGRGTILFTGGGLALDPTGALAAASLAVGKAGLRSLAQSLHGELALKGVHVGTVTVAGQIAPGTSFDPDRIADAFWSLHQDPPGAFRPEIIFKGNWRDRATAAGAMKSADPEAERNKDLVIGHFDDFVNERDLGAIDRNMAADFIDHDGPGGRTIDRDQDRAMMARMHELFPDLRVEVRHAVAEGDKVVVRNVWTGTNAQTGQRVEFHGFVLWRIAGGKIVERWATVSPMHELVARALEW